jgi:hypothetical protein
MWYELKERKKPKDNLSLLLLLLALLLGHTRKPVKPNSRKHVEDDESPQDAEVAPALAVAAVDLAQEDIRACVRAETAVFGALLSARLEATNAGGALVVLRQVGLASLASRRRKLQIFIGGAGDCVAGETDAEHAVHQIGERRQAVHEDPEARELAW